jgi:hypothetical protein
MHYQVSAQLQWLHQVGRGKGGIHHERQSGLVSNRCHPGYIQDVKPGVADRLGKYQSCVIAYRGPERLWITGIDEGRLDTEARQRVGEQVVTAMARCIAACPLAVAIAPTPPSSAAIRSSSTALVGLLSLE